MVKGGGRKVNHTSGKRISDMEDVMERNADETDRKPANEEEGGEEEDDKPKPKRTVVLERDDELEAELQKQFGDEGGLSRKQREELEKQEQERKEQKAMQEGSSDQAKQDLERLTEMRRKREEAAKQREKDKEAAELKAVQEAEKEQAKDKHRLVAEEIARLCKETEGGMLLLNQLNQDAKCKKTLKPLCKQHDVKAINKAWLEKFKTVVEIQQGEKDLEIRAK